MKIKKEVTIEVEDTIFNELILFTEKELNDYVSKVVEEAVILVKGDDKINMEYGML